MKRKRVMTEYGQRPSTTYQAEEFIVVNSGQKPVTQVEAGGMDIRLGSTGATVYDRSLAMEIKEKYKQDPNVMVIEKPWVRMSDGRKTHFTVPDLPWKGAGQEAPQTESAEVPARVEQSPDPKDGSLSGDGQRGN